ncbi:MAG TPA: homoserine O-succinyltransferase [Oleiagrimonas sp.]|nr:homoserine O-succinyltransferase [Oleiagrimonas sp.]
MTLEAVPLTSVATTVPKADAPARGSFCCIRASRHLRLKPKYGEGERGVEVRYLWTGAPGAPTVVVQGGISASRQVCRTEDSNEDGWWDALIGAGKAIDLDQVRVLSIDWLSAADLGAGSVSSEDQADAIAALLDALHIGSVKAFVGSSYGAMTGLAFASRHGHRLGRLVALAGAHRPHPLATAQRSIQRGILRLGLENGCRDVATSLARQLAMTTYRGSAEFAQRFDGDPAFVDGRYRLPVEDYLEHAGRKFADGFDCKRYLSLSESIDLHRVDPATVRTPATLVGFASDRLVPLGDLCELQRQLGAPASLEVVESLYGHDGFLKETAALPPLLRTALTEDSTTTMLL